MLGGIVAYGGAFTYYAAYGTCAIPNRKTGGCSCPFGYIKQGLISMGQNEVSPGGAVLYVCEK